MIFYSLVIINNKLKSALVGTFLLLLKYFLLTYKRCPERNDGEMSALGKVLNSLILFAAN